MDGSFGKSNAQPPTPTQTSTSGTFSSPIFWTPGAKEDFDDRSGWTSNFAEDYSVFNATPGRLTSSYISSFEINTPRPATSSSSKRPSSSTEELAAEIASHANHTVQSTLPFPPVDLSHRLSSSPGGEKAFAGQTEHNTINTKPKKSRRPVDRASGGQTATPPGSATKKPGKPALDIDTSPSMQRDEETMSIFDTPGPQHMLNFPSTTDMSAYPMSAPATAPAFTNTRLFWDPEANMNGLNLDFSGGDAGLLGGAVAHRLSTSFDWERENQMYQQVNDYPPFNLEIQQSRRQDVYPVSREQAQPLTSASTGLSFGFGGLMSDDPFAMTNNNIGAVDPGLLFATPGDYSASFSRTGAYGQAQSYGSQGYGSLKEQGSLHRSHSTKESSSRYSKQFFSSPAKPTRPGLQRSMSDSRTKRQPSQRIAQPAISNRLNPRAPSRSGRVSPLKQLSRPSLASIPESTPNIRTEVTFSIDANGRARTKTIKITDEPKKSRGKELTDGYESSHSDSSSDGEPIIIPSRPSSCSIPEKRKEPNLAQFDTACRSTKGRRQSNSGSSHISRSTSSQLDEESEAETVMIGDQSGNATEALKRAMSGRKKAGLGSINSQCVLSATPRYRYQYASTNNSPTTMTDPELGTPSTDRESSISDSTRCVCGRRDGDIFMIQWYVAFDIDAIYTPMCALHSDPYINGSMRQ